MFCCGPSGIVVKVYWNISRCYNWLQERDDRHSARCFECMYCNFQMLAVGSVVEKDIMSATHMTILGTFTPRQLDSLFVGNGRSIGVIIRPLCVCVCVYTALNFENIGVWRGLTGWRGERVGDADGLAGRTRTDPKAPSGLAWSSRPPKGSGKNTFNTLEFTLSQLISACRISTHKHWTVRRHMRLHTSNKPVDTRESIFS